MVVTEDYVNVSFELLCGADRKQRQIPVNSLPYTLHVGSSEGNPVPVEVSNSPAFDQHEQEIPSCISSVCGGCVHNANKCW